MSKIYDEIKKTGLDREIRELAVCVRGFMGVLKTPVEVAKSSGRSGVVNAIFDGAFTLYHCKAHVDAGDMGKLTAAKFVTLDMGNGFVTSAVGCAVAHGVGHVLKTQGPISFALGMGAAAGTRHVYRNLVGRYIGMDFKSWEEEFYAILPPITPDEEEEEEEEEEGGQTE